MVEPCDRSPPSPGASRRGEPASFWRAGHAALLLVFGSPLAFFVLCILAFMAAFFLQVGLDLQQLAFLLSLFCVHVQLLGQLADLPAHGNQRAAGGIEEDVLRYLGARSRLSRILSLAAWHLGITLLAIGILRNLLNDAFPARPELFPARVVVGFGFYFTAYLAITYLPIRKTLAKVGEALADRLIQQTLGAHATWKERFQEQQVARTYLGLQESAFQEFQQGLSVLSPLLASLSTLALGAGV